MSQNPSAGNINAGAGGAAESGLGGLAINSSFGQHFLNQAFAESEYEEARFEYKKIKGSPYLVEEPVKGILVLNNGSMVKDVLLQFDLYVDEIVATVDGEEIVLDSRFFSEVIFHIEGRDIILRKVNDAEPEKFYEILYQDTEMLFFKDRYVTLRERANSGLAKVDAKFTSRKKYFLKAGNADAQKVKLKKKDILSKMSKSKMKEMEAFAKENNIKFKKETDFVKAFESLNHSQEN